MYGYVNVIAEAIIVGSIVAIVFAIVNKNKK